MDSKNELPEFLKSYGLLIDHFDQILGDDNGSKGDIFVDFSTKVIPLSKIGSEFDDIKINKKKSHDKGVDAIAHNEEKTKILYIQAKYKIKDAPSFDNWTVRSSRKINEFARVPAPKVVQGAQSLKRSHNKAYRGSA